MSTKTSPAKNSEESQRDSQVKAPSITLPKGGGAIRGIGEKFAANPVTGTGSMTVPIATSPGRSGFGPQLSLSYDSGSGNGPFGLGWNLSLPSITRKTDKGLPKYQDGNESDTFILSGAEDLVPVLKQQGNDWVPEDVPDRTIGTDTYRIKRYRPRIEGLFARIERWTNTQSNETHWRSISRDNITTVYGRTTDSRIEDPDAPDGFPRVFSWPICESYDDKGNAIYYEYEPENSAGIDLAQTNERNRTDNSRSANRYLKRIKYGNKTPIELDSNLPREFREDLSERTDWLFEVVFDYEEGHYEELPSDPNAHQFVNAHKDPTKDWQRRQDPFSSFRSGFEVRTYRLCHRVLMFHHFPDELGVEDYLVRSTGFKYQESPIASFITSVTQSGYKLQDDGTYLKKSLPPLEFEYSKATIQEQVQDVDLESLENLPQGLDGMQYKWADIDGEGLSGILTEQGDSWFYKRNVSALPVMDEDSNPHTVARFAPTEQLATIPSFTNLSGGSQQLLDLAGDGQLDVVEFNSPTPGFFERTKDEAWHTFKPFESLPNISWQDPNLKFVDLTGDGHADIFITEDKAFTWYQSLAETGFGCGEKVRQALDEEKGPKLVFADGTQSIYLADISGDGLTDLVRIRNGEVCYWPNLGYGRFGARVTMDNSPHFDAPNQFDQRRIRLADIDGSGVTDIIYLKGDGVYIYLNESGNRWADAEKLKLFPHIDNLSSVIAVDLLGNGTACLVWSSPLPTHAHKPMRYIDLMGGQKPHLLVKTVNNLGAETHIHYAPSTRFYLADKLAGKPWITKIPFPVHVIERVETYDHISRNRFVTRYAYHHGYFDGVEREFRGFGMVEQWDTEEIGTIKADESSSEATNLDKASYVPPVKTKTWFHTGAYIRGEKISGQFETEYYREPVLTDTQYEAMLLPDTVLPVEITLSDSTGLSSDLTSAEIREACRALRGSILRQEVYAEDGSVKSEIPYTVSEQNYEIKWLQPRETNKHAVFFVHPRETINYHYERNSADPRTRHQLTQEVDVFGNVLKSAEIGYGRYKPDMNLAPEDRAKQTKILMTYTENKFTNPINLENAYRTPLPCETRTYEITGLKLDKKIRFSLTDMLDAGKTTTEILYEESPSGTLQKRLIEHVRTLYREDDLSKPLPLGKVESLALPFDSYKLAFTPGLLRDTYIDSSKISAVNLKDVLAKDGAYELSNDLKTQGLFPSTDKDGHWWIPSGQIFYSPDMNHTSVQELAFVKQHFFQPHRFQDPFGETTALKYDDYDLLLVKSTDPLENVVTVETKDDQSNDIIALDYRVMQPWLVVDPNDNRSAVAFDALGMVVGSAVMGKIGENKGDSLKDFEPNLDDNTIQAHIRNPFNNQHDLLKRVTTRLVYDLERYQRTSNGNDPQPNAVYTLARETHDADNQQTKIQHSFLYSDGFGREIQTKIQAEHGDAPLRQDNIADPDRPGKLILENNKPKIGPTDPRWVGTGRTIYNNKGKPVKKYEPFFSSTHLFEEEPEVVMTGVTPIIFYDPLERIVATLHPNHTYEKIVFDPWQQETWDVNDTLLHADPKNDSDVGDFFQRLDDTLYLPTWYESRKNGQLGAAEQSAANKAAKHTDTPGIAYLDTLGRTFLTIADNGLDENLKEQKYETRVELDIEGNQRKIIDARKNTVMQYDYDMLSNIIHQNSMDAGERWMLNSVLENPIKLWDSGKHEFSYSYDELQRPALMHVQGGDGNTVLDNVYEKIEYGDWKNMITAERNSSKDKNLIGQPKEYYDTAGKIEFELYDFKGNLMKSTRRLAEKYKKVVNWKGSNLDVLLEDEPFTTETEYDALNRVTKSKTPDGSITMPTYNEANLLETVSVTQGGTTSVFIKDINYNEKGQRTLIEYGNATAQTSIKTEYEYDPDTFRLSSMKATRMSDSKVLQDTNYTYDPVDNITEIRDDAHQTVFFNNAKVDPHTKYKYDPLYRLILAEGREHGGQLLQPQRQRTDKDFPLNDIPQPNNPEALRTYTEGYKYDAVGNIMKMIHTAQQGNWTRNYTYDTSSNRLTATSQPGDNPLGPYSGTYKHDKNGNMTQMPHLSTLKWDHEDQLKEVDLGGGGKAFYTYDSEGERVRKVAVYQNGGVKERIYLGGYEIFREYVSEAAMASGNIKKERETLHVMDDEQRIALVETETRKNSVATKNPQPRIRYQFSNHLGSASIETDPEGKVISFEEYYPYGGTAYHAVKSGVEVSAKQYRYNGKEKDEETGLYYYGARYYAVWLGRWVSCDPISLLGTTCKQPSNRATGSKTERYSPIKRGSREKSDGDEADSSILNDSVDIEDEINLYVYVRNNPINLNDQDGRKPKWALEAGPVDVLFNRWLRKRGMVRPPWTLKWLNKSEKLTLKDVENRFTKKYGKIGWPPNEKLFEGLEKNRANVRNRFFAAKQVVRNWYKRYGVWKTNQSPWQNFFYEHVYVGKIRGEALYKLFQKKIQKLHGGYQQPAAVNPYGEPPQFFEEWTFPVSRYNELSFELARRDPTSLYFYLNYRPWIRRNSPESYVDPPLSAQDKNKISTRNLINELSRLKKYLTERDVTIREFR